MPKSASLEIHQINVGQGDAILIINRDVAALQTLCASNGFAAGSDPIDCLPFAWANPGLDLSGTVKAAVLIDGGNDEFGGDLVDYLGWQGVLDPAQPSAPKLSVVVTHFHDDHIGGLRSIFNESVKKPGTKKTILQERHYPAHIYYPEANSLYDPDPGVRMHGLLADFARAELSGSKLHLIKPGATHYEKQPDGTYSEKRLSIELENGATGLPIRLTAIACGQTIFLGNKHQIAGTLGSDQNDRSLVLLLEYGEFRYFLGGDIAGNGTVLGGNEKYAMALTKPNKGRGSMHTDLETMVGQALEEMIPSGGGHCCGFKANHHASSSSVDAYLLSTMQPRIAVIASGVSTYFHHHPTAEVLGRMLDLADWFKRPSDPSVEPSSSTPKIHNSLDPKGIYATEIADQYKGTKFHGDVRSERLAAQVKILGDLVVRPTDESIAMVRSAPAPKPAIDIQVYGTGEQFKLPALPPKNSTTLRSVDSSKSAPYCIGPFWHKCHKH